MLMEFNDIVGCYFDDIYDYIMLLRKIIDIACKYKTIFQKLHQKVKKLHVSINNHDCRTNLSIIGQI